MVFHRVFWKICEPSNWIMKPKVSGENKQSLSCHYRDNNYTFIFSHIRFGSSFQQYLQLFSLLTATHKERILFQPSIFKGYVRFQGDDMRPNFRPFWGFKKFFGEQWTCPSCFFGDAGFFWVPDRPSFCIPTLLCFQDIPYLRDETFQDGRPGFVHRSNAIRYKM